jgi:hypothetical protein
MAFSSFPRRIFPFSSFLFLSFPFYFPGSVRSRCMLCFYDDTRVPLSPLSPSSLLLSTYVYISLSLSMSSLQEERIEERGKFQPRCSLASAAQTEK